jgi:hypothetical protein
VIIAEEIGPEGVVDSGRCFACETVGIFLVGRSRDASTWERLRPHFDSNEWSCESILSLERAKASWLSLLQSITAKLRQSERKVASSRRRLLSVPLNARVITK